MRGGADAGGEPMLGDANAGGPSLGDMPAATPRWEDYVLDGILRGASNPFAAAATAGIREPDGRVSPPTVSRLDPVLVYAAESDLQILQHLCVAQSTLVDWVAAVAGLRNDDPWVAAASKSSTLNGHAALNGAAPGPQAKLPTNLQVQTREHRAQMARRIGAYQSWSQALEDLCLHYYQHGTGDFATTSVFSWLPTEGKLVPLAGPEMGASDAHQAPTRHPRLDTRKLFPEVRRELEETLGRFLAGGRSPHLVLSGLKGSGKTWLLQEVTSEAFAKGLRVVQLPRKDIRLLPSLGKSLAKFPRARFAVVLEDIWLQDGGDDYQAIKAALDVSFSGSWPTNALICATTCGRACEEASALFEKVLYLNPEIFVWKPEELSEYLPQWSAAVLKRAPVDLAPNWTARNVRELAQIAELYMEAMMDE
eukprot:jgi/Mesvir1/2452/Mv20038-RA.3